MITALHILKSDPLDDAILAWANYRALRLAEQTDPSLVDDPDHQKAVEIAHARMVRTYEEWAG